MGLAAFNRMRKQKNQEKEKNQNLKSDEKLDYSEMKYNDLKKLLSEKGVNCGVGMKKEELIKALEELEE